MKRARFAALGAAILLALVSRMELEPDRDPAPAIEPSGIVLVSIDTLRADAVFPEAGPTLMPLLARRARERGQIVANHYATSTWTLPSHASMLSGRYPSGHGAEHGRPANLRGGDLLPEKLVRGGWFTGAISGGGFVSRTFGLDQGFEVFLEAPDPEDETFIPRMLESLEPELKRRPFFLFLHTFMLHNYFLDATDSNVGSRLLKGSALLDTLQQFRSDPPPEGADVARFARDLYAQRARRVDVWLSGLLDRLDREYRGAKPIVVITSDHGEAFGEGPYRRGWHHGAAADESVARVPLVILYPDRQPRPTIATLTSAIDLTPTILSWSGLTEPATEYVGVDLMEPGIRRRGRVYSETFLDKEESWALLSERWKLIHTGAGPGRRTDWIPGRPGAFDEDAARVPGQNELKAASDTRQVDLQATVDGLFLEASNAGGEPCHLVATLAFADSPGERPVSASAVSPFAPHLLEAEDAATMVGTSRTVEVNLTLPPSDVDLLVVKEPEDIGVTLASSSIAVSIGGRRPMFEPLRVGRLITPRLAAPPPRLPGCQLRIWENRPPGVTSRISESRASELSPETRERLRALGYVR